MSLLFLRFICRSKHLRWNIDILTIENRKPSLIIKLDGKLIIFNFNKQVQKSPPLLLKFFFWSTNSGWLITLKSSSNLSLLTRDSSSHLMLFDIMKLWLSTIYSEQILQSLTLHLKSPFCCPKALFSVLNLARVNNWSNFWDCFCEKITFLFLNTSGRCLD